MRSHTTPAIVALHAEQQGALHWRIEASHFTPEDVETLTAALSVCLRVKHLIDQKSTSLASLRKLLLGANTTRPTSNWNTP